MRRLSPIRPAQDDLPGRSLNEARVFYLLDEIQRAGQLAVADGEAYER